MTAWTVVSIAKVVDGDSLLLIRTRTIGHADGLIFAATDVRPVRVRLIHLDTPERGEAGWGQAKADLEAWIDSHAWLNGMGELDYDLELHDAGRDAFGRVLGDLRTPEGESATIHMVRDKGWPVYEEKR